MDTLLLYIILWVTLRMGDNWYDSVPRIQMVLANYGMSAQIS